MRFIIIFLFFPAFLAAQDFVDIVELDYRLSPEIPLTLDDEQKEDITDLHARILYPHVIDSSSTLLLSLVYNRLNISPLELHSISGLFGLDRQLGDNTRLLALLIPKVSSDLKDFSKRDLQLGGLVILTNSIREDFAWKYGAYANADLFGPMLVPIIGFKWQADPSLRIEASLPLSAHIRKTVSSNLITGIKYSGRKYSYNLSEASSYMEVGDNHVWAYADFYLTSSWILQVRAGHSILRSYAIYSNEETIAASLGPVNFGDDRPDPIYERKNGASFQIGLRYRYSIDK